MEIKSTRDRILQTLLHRPFSSINEMAESVGINAISVRHHLTSLQAEGLVAAEEERHGVGRPRLVYFLTEKGTEKFPTRYLNLTNKLLSQLKERLSDEAIKEFFYQMGSEVASSYSDRTEKLTFDERVAFIRDSLSKEGFFVEIENKDDQLAVYEISCPYFQVSQQHPEICMLDQMIISKILGLPVQKVQSIVEGDRHCKYIVKHPNADQRSLT